MASELRVDRIIPVNGVPTGGAGGVIQIVSSKLTSQVTTTSGNWDSTGLSVNITPIRSDSKIMLQMTAGKCGSAGGSGTQVYGATIYRDSTNLGGGEGLNCLYTTAPDNYQQFSIVYIDSPSTTSSITYTVYHKRISGNGTHSFVRDGTTAATLVAMEVSG